MNSQIWPAIEEMVVDENEIRKDLLGTEVKNANKEINKILKQPVKVERKQVEKLVYGFPQIAEEKTEKKPDAKEKQEFRNGKQKELDKCNALTQAQIDLSEKMQLKGLRPIAVVPEKLFNAICKNFGIYRFENMQEDGKAKIKKADETDMFKVTFFLGGIISAIIFGLVGIFAYDGSFLTFFLYLTFVLSISSSVLVKMKWRTRLPLLLLSVASLSGSVTTTSLHGTVIIGTVIVTVFLSFMIAGVFSMITTSFDEPAKSILKIIHRILIKYLSDKRLLKILWPEGVDVSGSKYNEITVRFPKAPEYFIETLTALKETRLQPMIAATQEAIQVDRQELRRIRIKEIEEIDPEPILYYKEKGNVAILSFFGKFPNELKIIEWVKNVGLKICFN